MKHLVLKQLMLAGLITVGAGPALAASMETTALQPTAVISPWTYWPSNPTAGRFYRPAGIQAGNSFFIYVQGGAYTTTHTGPGSENCPSSGEKILAFSTPWTAQGLRSTFSYAGVVSPCFPSLPRVHFQTGSAFRSSTDGQIKLLVDESRGGSNVLHGDFKNVYLGSSSDGINFAWSTFLQQSTVSGTTYSPYTVKLVQATANSNWWGTFWWAFCYRCDGTDGGPSQSGRIKVIMDATNPRGYVVWLLSGDNVTWQRVNDDGTFNFAPGAYGSILAHSIVLNNGAWEAWGDSGDYAATAGCFVGTPGSSTFQYQTTNQAAAYGPVQAVTSQVRAMPTQNWSGRLSPFRMQDMNGARLLYSASTDRLCAAGVDAGFGGAEIIVTNVNN